MTNRHLKSAVLALAACAGLASCVKDEYDLSKDMDLNVTVGGDLALPVGNTEDITLDQVIDLDDDNKLDTIAAGRDYKGTLMEGMEVGDYFFYTSSADDDNRNTFMLKPIIVNLKPTEEFATKDDINIDATSELKKVTVPGVGQVDLTTTTQFDNEYISIPSDFNEEEVAELKDFEVDFDFDNSITRQVVRLDDVDFELYEEGKNLKGKPVFIEMKTFVVGGEGKEFHIKAGTQFSMPTWVKFDIDNNQYFNEVRRTTSEYTIELKDDLVIPANGNSTLSLRLIGINCEGAVKENNRGHFLRQGKVEINGNVSMRLPIRGKSMKIGELKKALTATFKVHGQLNNPSINITRAQGMFEPDDIDVKSFEIKNMPDIINDKDTRIFITSPAIRFTVSQDQPMSVQTMTLNNISITSQFNDGTPTHKEDIPVLSMEESHDKNNRFVLVSRTATGKNADAFKALLNVVNYSGRIPSNIDMSIDNARIEGMLQPDTEYLIEYEFVMPFSFQNGKINDEIVRTQLAYNDTIDGWNEDIADDIDKIKEAKGMIARATSVNTTPFELIVNDIKVIDINGKELKDVRVTNFKDIKITPDAETPVVVDIDCNADQLTKIDGIVYSVAAIVGDQYQDVTLNNRKHRLSLRNARIQLKGGITVDLND